MEPSQLHFVSLFFSFLLSAIVVNSAGITSPLEIPFGFSTKGLEFQSDGSTTRSFNSAQHIAAMKLALSDANALMASLSQPSLSVTLKPRVYQGNQIQLESSTYVRNEFFDGSFGGYVIGNDVVGIISSDESLDTTRSMTQSFAGWDVSTFIVSQQNTEFSHASSYPLKARIVPSDSLQSIVLKEIIQKYDWKRVAIFYSSDQVGIDLRTNFMRTVDTSSILGTTKSDVTVLFESVISVSGTDTDYQGEIEAAKQSGATILLLLMGASAQAKLLEQCYTHGLLSSSTQTIGVSLSTDAPEYGGKSVDEHLISNGASMDHVKDILKGHMVLTFEPKVLFQTSAGKDFLKKFKSITPTWKPNGGFAPKTAAFLADSTNRVPQSSTPPFGQPSYADEAKGLGWFLDHCYTWDEVNQIYFEDSYDGRYPPAPYTLGAMPGSPGFLYAAMNGGGLRDPFIIDPRGGADPTNNVYVYGLIQWSCTPPYQAQQSATCNGFGCGGNGVVGYPAPSCGTLPFDNKPVPVWGTCLGLSAEELAAITPDGSSGIDWKTLYIYDAVMFMAHI